MDGFSTSNVNWAPNLLDKSWTFHDSYTNISQGIESDTQDMSQSPQFIMEISNPTSSSMPVYVMLSRHYTDYSQLLGNENFRVLLSLQIFEIDKPRLIVKNSNAISRVKPTIVFTNTPYDFAKVYVPPGRHFYAAVVQTVKDSPASNKRFDFTIQFRYCSFIQGEIKLINDYPEYHFTWRIGGMWNQSNNGGRRSLMKYGMNPVYDFSIPTTMTAIFYLELVHNNKLAIHLCLYTKRDWEAQNFNNVLIDSGDYRNWSCDFLTTLEPGDYSLVASSYPSVMNIGFLH